MPYIRLTIWAAFLLFLACKPSTTTSTEGNEAGAQSNATSAQPPGLQLLWETEKSLTTSESVFYDADNNVLYVSCINGVPPDKKDGDGFIARVGLDGAIIELNWVTGVSAPKGMGKKDNTLYVTDINRLVAIDITTATISRSWEIEGAQFLNDVFVAEDGKVYFSDSNTNTLHVLDGDEVRVVYQGEDLGGPNGILVEGQLVYIPGFATGVLSVFDLSQGKVNKLVEGIPGGDGVERYGNGLLVSNWNGEVYFVDPATGSAYEILDSQEAKLNAADIEVIADKHVLFIPTFFGNSVMAYELKTVQAE
jgi:outer membrane protein assembly factor BamB